MHDHPSFGEYLAGERLEHRPVFRFLLDLCVAVVIGGSVVLLCMVNVLQWVRRCFLVCASLTIISCQNA
jgi:hypothetical protein